RSVVLAVIPDNLAEIRGRRRQIRIARKHRRVGRVEGLEAELRRHAFANAGSLDCGSIGRSGPAVADVSPARRRSLKSIRWTHPEDRLLPWKHVANDAVGVDVSGLEKPVPSRIVQLRIADHPYAARNAHRSASLEHGVHQDLPSAYQTADNRIPRVE